MVFSMTQSHSSLLECLMPAHTLWGPGRSPCDLFIYYLFLRKFQLKINLSKFRMTSILSVHIWSSMHFFKCPNHRQISEPRQGPVRGSWSNYKQWAFSQRMFSRYWIVILMGEDLWVHALVLVQEELNGEQRVDCRLVHNLSSPSGWVNMCLKTTNQEPRRCGSIVYFLVMAHSPPLFPLLLL